MKAKITLDNLVVAFVAKDKKETMYNRYVIGMQYWFQTKKDAWMKISQAKKKAKNLHYLNVRCNL